MRWRNNPRVLKWVEAFTAIYALHGVGWMVAGYHIEGLVRMLAGWVLMAFVATTMFLMWDLFSFLPGDLFLAAGIPPILLWPAAAAWSSRSLERRLRASSDAAA